ncbi:Aldo/keto reductase [Thelephora ganbajun]|uniref:Aldo/keto reductase n=1 Tax=Thelephora ganbajun TaxID=370292 RepID=A0ACB6Z4K0_THEGA|nr:Aldo/keto reductase [Thelephora ganbajun]
MTFQTRVFGDKSFNAIGYGGMGLSVIYGSVGTDEERLKVLDAVYESGCTFWDTADVYGDNEELLAKWFKKTGKRNDIFLATKFGFAHGEPGRLVKADPEYVPEAFNKSLSRLGVDYVDIYYLHRADPTVPIEHTVAEMAKLVKAGKVKHLGLSEVSASTLRRAYAVHPISAVQVEYSPFTLDIEDESIGLLKAARELGVKIVAYSPLGRGLITGRYKSPDDFEDGDFRKCIPRYSKENFPNILKVADGLEEIGDKYNATAGQIALGWLLAQGEDVIPIPGTTRLSNLKENIEAGKIRLSPEDVQAVREVVDKANATQGDRYPEDYLNSLFVDTPLP